ncbi:MAG: hypothetical protein Q4C53_02860 [Clostridia bacterium]|nr:hypothetical protein [Clostridia bacterium]
MKHPYKAVPAALALLGAALLFGCVAKEPLPSEAESTPAATAAETDETAFRRHAEEAGMTEFLAPAPGYGEDDPYAELKRTADTYLSERARILADINAPFSTLPAVANMLAVCAPDYRQEAKLTAWYLFYLRKINENGFDLSYGHYEHRTRYLDVVCDGDLAVVTVMDLLQFRTVNTDTISGQADLHTLTLTRTDGAWQVAGDDPGEFLAHITAAYARFSAECPYPDGPEAERDIMDRFAAWSDRPQPPADVTG